MRWFEGGVTTRRVVTPAEVTRQLEAELVRGRRHGSSVSLVVVAERGRSTPVASLAAVVRDAVRRYDVVFPQADGSVLVLTPNAGAADAREIARRLSGTTGRPCAASTASEDGDEAEAMVRRAFVRLGDRSRDGQA